MEVFERKIGIANNTGNGSKVIPGISITVASLQYSNFEIPTPVTYYLGTRGYEISINQSLGLAASIITIDFSVFSGTPGIFKISGFTWLKIINFSGTLESLYSYLNLQEMCDPRVDIKNSCIYSENENIEFEKLLPLEFQENVTFLSKNSIVEILNFDSEKIWKLTEDPVILTSLSEVTGLTKSEINKLARVKNMCF